MGIGQVMPETAKVLAGRVGLPYRPDLMRGTSPEARQYQDRITEAAAQEAWQAGGGDPRKAAMYYHGGSDQSGWGSKTHRYADEVIGRMGSRTVANPDRSQWDKRADGSEKGDGWLGVMKRPDGKVSSELSIGVEIDGKETEIPSMVPGLTEAEINWLLRNPPSSKMPSTIIQKAVAFARQRIAQGKSPFRQRGEPIGGN